MLEIFPHSFFEEGERNVRNLKNVLLIIISLTIFAGILSAQDNAQPAGKQNRKNFILIVIDATRADHVTGYGYPRYTTPVLDKLAENGVFFSMGFAQATWTCPSVVSILTSLYPATHGVVTKNKSETDYVRPPLKMAAEIFRDAGYYTEAFIEHMWLTEKLGYNQGFRKYNVLCCKGAGWVGDIMLEALQEGREQPFFWYVHLFDPHGTYEPPEPFNRFYGDDGYDVEWTLGIPEISKQQGVNKLWYDKARTKLVLDMAHYHSQYDGEIRNADYHIGRLLRELSKKGLLENTMIAVTADHGEEFYDHGRWGHNALFWEEIIHVPYMMYFPEETYKGLKIDWMVETIDILPTALSYLNIPAPPDFQGIDLMPLLNYFSARSNRGGKDSEFAKIRAKYNRDYVFADLPPGAACIRTRDYKYMHSWDNVLPDIKLFDLKTDIAEKTPLKDRQDVRNKLQKILEEWRGSNNKLSKKYEHKTMKKTLTQEEMEGLRALGYVD